MALLAPDADLLRFTTAGSVDDGKSTLIGRLLYDTKSILEDQLEALERATRRRGEEGINLALLTDGLRAEREQNITIDVAYRYFATPSRKFIIADTPGHIQYTRNMVTGASTAELAVILVDARRGVLTQSKRHGFIASLLRIPHIVVAVNKMDLVDYDRSVFQEIVEDYREFAQKLDVQDLTFIPISALYGDNIVHKSERTPWYDGATLLHHLETVNVGATRNLVDFRFPVQTVIRPHQDYRGFAGRIASGTISPGEEVVVLPSGRGTRIRSVDTADGAVAEAIAGDSVVLTVEDDIDISRGDMIVRRRNLPTVGRRFDAILCWMAEPPLNRATSYVLMHTTRRVRAFVSELLYRIDVDTLHRDEVTTLGLNDIGRVQIATAEPIFFDAYQKDRATGAFILIDPFSNMTVGAGLIREAVLEQPGGGLGTQDVRRSPHVQAPPINVGREEREARNGHRAAVLWLTGLSGAGKSTVAREVERRLYDAGCQTVLLDGDAVRQGLCGDLGFGPDDRAENIRRVGEVARLFFEQGSIVMCSFVSPFRRDRDAVRRRVPEGRFYEVFIDCDLATCEARDPKGLYQRARRGEIPDFTGITSPYETPPSAELHLHTDALPPDQAADCIMERLRADGIVP